MASETYFNRAAGGFVHVRKTEDYNVSVPRKFTLRFHVSYTNCIVYGESTSQWRFCLW